MADDAKLKEDIRDIVREVTEPQFRTLRDEFRDLFQQVLTKLTALDQKIDPRRPPGQRMNDLEPIQSDDQDNEPSAPPPWAGYLLAMGFVAVVWSACLFWVLVARK